MRDDPTAPVDVVRLRYSGEPVRAAAPTTAVADRGIGDIEPIKKVRFDLIFLTVKSFDTATASAEIAPLVSTDTLVINAQNGYGNYEIASSIVGPEHTLLSRVIFGVKLPAPGRAEVTVIADAVRMGQPQNAVPKDRVTLICKQITEAGIPTEYEPKITSLLWDKILYNTVLNPLGAILECSYGELAATPDAHKLMNDIIDEMFLVAKAHRIPLNWKTAEEYREHFYTRLVPPTAKHYPSMYYDLKAGKRIEIDALSGAIVRLAREEGLSAPMNEAITHLLKAREALMIAKNRR